MSESNRITQLVPWWKVNGSSVPITASHRHELQPGPALQSNDVMVPQPSAG